MIKPKTIEDSVGFCYNYHIFENAVLFIKKTAPIFLRKPNGGKTYNGKAYSCFSDRLYL